MTDPVLLPGKRFRIFRENDAIPGQYDFVCVATSVELTRTNDYDDATVNDCDDPLAIPTRRSIKKSTSWAISISGRSDPKRIELVEADFAAENAHNYQIKVDRPGAQGGKTYTGAAHIENMTVGTADLGMVTFNASLRGDGALATAALP